jgi:predicted nucleotidyltransferase
LINVTSWELAIIKNILQIAPKNTKVFAFGSRFKKNNKPYSDLDLVIDAGHPLGIIKIQQFKEDFMGSRLPYRIDLVDYHSISPEFRQIIDQGKELIFEN